MATILLVDDDAGLVEACKLIVTQHGHEVRVAYSADEARKVLKGGRPDVIVLDVMMERKDSGFELAREIQEQYPNLPVILLTSVHQAAARSFHFEQDETWLPVVKFLDKPVDPAVLAQQIDALLAR